MTETTNNRDDAKDASRYRYLRQLSYRNRTGRKYTVQLHFEEPQNSDWPDQHAFNDFDCAVDSAMLPNAPDQRPEQKPKV